MSRTSLGEHRVNYAFTCGVCGTEIHGKSNTVHLGIGSHVRAEYKRGLRFMPYVSPRLYGDSWKKFI